MLIFYSFTSEPILETLKQYIPIFTNCSSLSFCPPQTPAASQGCPCAPAASARSRPLVQAFPLGWYSLPWGPATAGMSSTFRLHSGHFPPWIVCVSQQESPQEGHRTRARVTSGVSTTSSSDTVTIESDVSSSVISSAMSTGNLATWPAGWLAGRLAGWLADCLRAFRCRFQAVEAPDVFS